MNRLLITLALAGLAAGAWHLAATDAFDDVPIPVLPEPAGEAGHAAGDPGPAGGRGAPPGPAVWPRRLALHRARALAKQEPLDTFVRAQRERVESAPDPRTRGRALTVLAEALLERIYQRTSRMGLRPGEPLYDAVPADTARDVRDGLAALAQARALGVETGDGYRVEAGLLTSRITGTLSALGLKREIARCYSRALALDPNDPRLHVALGCRKLFAPRFLGRDTEKALEHLVYACKQLPADERPRVFAGLAAWMLGDHAAARKWVEHAVAVNPRSDFAFAVLRRILAGESEPFARDI